MGSWCGIYDGGDLEDVVRGSTLVLPREFTLHQATCVSATSEPAQSTFSSVKKHDALKSDEVRNKIMPFTLTNTKQEPASPEIIRGVESSPPASISLNSSPRSPTRHATGLHNPAATKVVDRTSSAIKTESTARSLRKLPGLKRRKSEERRVMCVPMAEGSWNKQGGAGVSSDLWSWRKYGQKPIKGSPYPRGYYRCSSSKGCPARKQIERSRTNPTTLLITYSADHNHVWPAHRNALARSSRQILLHDKQVPNSSDVAVPPSNDNDDGVSSLNDKWGPHFHSVDEEDQHHVGFDHHNATAANHYILDHDLFADLGELPELYLNHSGEEDAATIVDPFNLFDWSFSANEMPNS